MFQNWWVAWNIELKHDAIGFQGNRKVRKYVAVQETIFGELGEISQVVQYLNDISSTQGTYL